MTRLSVNDVYVRMLAVCEKNAVGLRAYTGDNDSTLFDSVVNELSAIDADVVDVAGYGDGTIGLIYDVLLNDACVESKKLAYIKSLYDIRA